MKQGDHQNHSYPPAKYCMPGVDPAAKFGGGGCKPSFNNQILTEKVMKSINLNTNKVLILGRVKS